MYAGRILLLCLAIPGLGSVARAEWKPGKAPLMTRWAKDVTPEKAWPEYPRPQMVRKDWTNLNGLWDYAITPRDGNRPEKFDGQILVPYPVESALSGVMKPVGADSCLWYRRVIEHPAPGKGERVLMHFGAVDWEATVHVNGKEVGTHRGGHDPFTFDITEALKPGAKQEFVVRVWDPTNSGAQPRGKQVNKPGGIFYTAVTGIWQTVWLERVPASSIDRLQPVADVEGKTLRLTVQPRGAEKGDVIRAVALADGKEVGRAEGQPGQELKLKLSEVKLWSPDSPFLYDLKVTLRRDGRDIDEVSSYFAMRSIAMGKDGAGVQRLLLNGKPLFQWGTLDQGWWPDGLLSPPSDAAMAYDLKVLKDLGFNMLRKHVKVEPARLYYHCDKMGLLVWQDMPSGGVPSRGHFIKPDATEDAKLTAEEKAQFKAEWKAILDSLAFFPCIVVWVPFNEGWGQHDTNDVLKWTMQADPTRLVDGPSGWTDRGVGHMKDLHQYPGPGMFPVMPDRVSVLGEFGGLGLPLKDHLWKDTQNWGYRTYKTKEELSDNYRRLMVQLRLLIPKGLAAAIYTQTTDVETEVNGLLTYDREVIKLDVKEAAEWHRKLFAPAPEEKTLVPTSEKEAQQWRYTPWRLQEGWFKEDFNDSKWTQGDGGFGADGTPGAVLRTPWRSKEIWLRRSFELKELPRGEAMFRMHYDEDTVIYINGVEAARTTGYTTGYTLVPLTADGVKALREGKNVLAVHCKQVTGGGQYIDVGLMELVEKR